MMLGEASPGVLVCGGVNLPAGESAIKDLLRGLGMLPIPVPATVALNQSDNRPDDQRDERDPEKPPSGSIPQPPSRTCLRIPSPSRNRA